MRIMRILFCDLNNTIIDDMPIWENAMRKTFLASGKNPPTIEEYFRELKGDYLEIYRKRGILASREELNEIYEKEYERQLKNIKLFPDVKETLINLHERDVYLALITIQKEKLAVPLLKKLGIYKLFRSFSFHTRNKEEAILDVVGFTGFWPRQYYFVGDSPSDMQQAKKAGAIAIAFLNGYIPEDLLMATEADYNIGNFKDILNII